MDIGKYVTKKNAAYAVGMVLALFHLYTGVFGTLEALLQRSVHLLLVLILVFLLHPLKQGPGKYGRLLDVVDYLLILLSLLGPGYLIANFDYVSQDRIYFITPLLPIEKVLGLVTILLIIEAARRVVGWFLTGVALGLLLIVPLGPYLPGFLHYPGVTLDMFVDIQYLTLTGIFGIPLGISATYIVLLIIFGGFMIQTGFGEFISNAVIGIAGTFRGGSAKVAVVSSALFGTITGSASANVAVTGNFTIPMMKKAGFRPHFAGAVEAAASTGGQIAPPIMGAAAFLMAEYLDMPYFSIMKHAIIPAILYFTGVFMMVDLEAARTGIRGMTEDELPPWKHNVAIYAHLLIPIVLLLVLMAIGRTIFYAVTVSIFANILLSFFREKTRLNAKKIFLALWTGAQGTLIVAVACAIAGVMIGNIYMTGMGDRFVSSLVALSHGHLIIALVITMVAAIVLGMGMPTSASYVLMVALLVPALIKIGILPLAAHMFVFYFACLSLVTPPVATASYVAAGIAGSGMTETSWTAFRIAAAAYIVPFMFVYAPSLLLVGEWSAVALSLVSAVVGVFALACSLQAFWMAPLGWVERIVAFIAALCMIFPGWKTDLTGLSLLILLFLYIRWIKMRAPSPRPTPHTGT